MSEWEPATEAEAAMREALSASDQEQYFAILARLELVLPVSVDALAGRAPMGWGTWTTGDRTHILAFTSPMALRLCLNEPGGSYRPMPFQSLAAEWPNYEWWLAVNPGLPIESYLPSWFVAQLTRGDVRLPGRTMGARARMAQSDLAAALHGRVRASAPAPGRAETIAAQPVRSGVGERPGAAVPVETVEAEVVDYPPAAAAPPVAARVYTSTYGSRTPAYDPEPTPHVPEPAAAARPYEAPAYADQAETPVVHRPGLGAMLAGSGVGTAFVDSAAFAPADVPGRGRVSIAAESSDVAGRDIWESSDVAGRDVWEPTTTAAAEGDSPGPARLRSSVVPDEPVPPEPAVSPEPVPPRTARRDVQDAEVVSPPGGWESGFVPANETESNLLVAAEENNTDSFLSTLLLARVILPVPVGTPSGARPRDDKFPWQIDEMDGQPFISVFTSPERMSEHRSARLGTDLSSVSLRFVQLIGAWPSEEISFAINPGSPVGATLPGSQIVALAAWAAEVGLRDEPSAEVMVAPKKHESTPSMGVAGAPANGADRATVMQRTVPHSQVPFYVERGYDRVSGFVNRASEVSHLDSPKVLYRALGLIYPGSSFSEDDAEVHVVRWVAHRSDLYRLPYGGPHEAGMRAMQGWVIERPPFRGNGFAPGDTEVVAEFKVDSIRLPHGAQMWRLAKDATQSLVATFDADTTRWVPPPFGFGGGYA